MINDSKKEQMKVLRWDLQNKEGREIIQISFARTNKENIIKMVLQYKERRGISNLVSFNMRKEVNNSISFKIRKEKIIILLLSK